MTPKALFIKQQIIKLDLIKSKTSALWKTSLDYIKKNHTLRESICKKCIWRRSTIQNIKVYSKPSNKKQII